MADLPPTKKILVPGLTTASAAYGIRLSADGTTVAITGDGPVKKDEVSGIRTIYLDLATGSPVGPPLVLNGPGLLSGNGSSVAYFHNATAGDAQVVVREIATGKESRPLKVKNGSEPYRYAPDGTLLIAGRGTDLVSAKVPSGAAAFPPSRASANIEALTNIYSGGTRVAGLLASGRLAVWDLTNGKLVGEFDPGEQVSAGGAFAVAEDGRVMTLWGKRSLIAWDLVDKRKIRDVPLGSNSVAPLSGGLLLYQKQDFNYTREQGPGGKTSVKTTITHYAAVADAATGEIRRRVVVPPGVIPEDDSRHFATDTAVATADGRRVVVFVPSKLLLLVWDIPPQP